MTILTKDLPMFPPHVSQSMFVFGTMDWLPTFDTLPENYQRGTARGCKIVATIFHRGWGALSNELLAGSFDLASPPNNYSYGDEVVDPVDRFQRCITAHLTSWGPKHEHKIAGVGYMIDQWAKDSVIE